MFDVPERYLKEQPIDVKQFIRRDMRKSEKDRVRAGLQSVSLVWQIAGEEIPSFMDEDYNCSVIMGLDVQLQSLKGVAHFAELIQHMVKAPCMIRFYDNAHEVFSFAHKRLSHTNSSQVVIVDKVLTPPLSIAFPEKTAVKLKQSLAFGALLNKSDKLSLYLEATVKAFIVSHSKLYNGIEKLVDENSEVWYNRGEVLVLFEKLLKLQRLMTAARAEKLPGERARLNGEIKRVLEELR